jgi:protein O-GlcNAc transferase
VPSVSDTFALALRQHQAGDLAGAEQHYRQILQADSSHADAWAYLGAVCQAQGRFAEAETSFRRVVQLVPTHIKAQNCLATVLVHQGKLDEALAGLEEAHAALPDNAEIHNNRGVVFAQLGRTAEAADSFRQALRCKADFAQAHYNLGLALRKAGQNDEAIAEFQETLRCQPAFAPAMHDLGHALADVGQFAEAESCYRQVLQLHPDYAEAHANLGSTLQSQGRLDEAVASFREALRLNPHFAEAYYNLGNALHSMERFEEAAASHRQALTVNPAHAEAHNNLGLAERKLGHLEEAVACHRRALQLKPNLAQIHINLGGALSELGQVPESIACYRKALQLQPENLAVVAGASATSYTVGQLLQLPPGNTAVTAELVHQLQRICLWEDLLPLSQRVVEAVEHDAARSVADSVSPFAFLALPTFTTAHQQLLCARKWVEQRLHPPLPQQAPFTFDRPRRPEAKITIGYLSADFHEHATAYLIAEVIEKHDRQHFTVVGYSYGPDDGSPMRRRLLKAFDRFVDLKDYSASQAAQRIHADEVDILVDLKGYTRHARTAIMALRPAPIQAQYLGYPGTMGADFIDYILVDDFIVPPDQQPFFTEKLIHLPGCYQCNDSQRPIATPTPTKTECGLPETDFVFCGFNNTYKITPEMFDVWMRLLKAVPGSVLWLLEDNPFAPANLRREARVRGVLPERLVFAPRLPLARHLARHQLADLFLDTVPYNAHTTASDALWAGCPVLTLAGQTFPARVAGSLLRAIGLPELITTSLEQYEELALRLARDGELLANLKTRLGANRETSGLFDGAQFARGLERAYSTMVEIRGNGEKPRASVPIPTAALQPAKTHHPAAKPSGDELASIIILCCDQLEFTRQCITSVLQHTRPPYELLLVDNGSTDGTPAYLNDLKTRPGPQRVAVICNDTNRGFAAGCNQGLAESHGRYLVLLNNDTVVTPGWLEGLIAWSLDDWPHVGLVGPMTNYCTPPQAVSIDYRTPEELVAFAAHRRQAFAGQAVAVRRLMGFCLFLRREVWDTIGGLDESFGLGYFEDDDLCMRAREAGFRLTLALDVFIHHYGSATFRGLNIDHRALLQLNLEKFRAKWGDQYSDGHWLRE